MPTSTVIGDILALRAAKIAKRTAATTYGTTRLLYGTVTVRAAATLINAIRIGDGQRLAAVTRVNGGKLNLEFAANNLQIFADILGLSYGISGSTPNQVGKLQIYNKSLPYFGFTAGADDDAGNENVFHLWGPKLKITSNEILLVQLSGSDNPEFGNVSIECEAFTDEGYTDGTEADAVQDIDITGTPTGGTFTLSFGTETTSAIAFDANAAAVTTALEALNNIGTGNIVVTGTNPNFVATFGGTLANTKVPVLTADGAALTGGTTPDVTVTNTTDGATGNDLIMTMYEDEQGTTPLIPPAL